MTTRHATAPNDKALTAFLAVKHEIDGMLASLNTLSDHHFDTDPDAINRGNVSTLNHCASLLRQITCSALSKGRHAE